MQYDALFRIYSMTREVTSAAVLKLYEEGKFQLDDPIKMYLPEFENQRVLLDSSSTDITQTKARTGDITVANLLTHTSGLGSRSSALCIEKIMLGTRTLRLIRWFPMQRGFHYFKILAHSSATGYMPPY